ncbi:MAG TPA: hypothetical protein VGL55_12235 [Steroidobacteraceae bacterium]|jgi:hypothetical protein
MNPSPGESPDTPLERAHELLVSALNKEPPGTEARYLARLVLLLLNELQYSGRALSLIETARQGDQAP